MITTIIGGRLLKVKPGKTVVEFTSGEHGIRERGKYAFWTVILDKKMAGKQRLIGRARVALDPGERFRRMEREMVDCESPSDRKIYRKFWRMMKHAKYIRPATKREVDRWMNSHASDAKYAKWGNS